MSKIPAKPEAYYNALTNSMIAEMARSNQQMLEQHTNSVMHAVQGGQPTTPAVVGAPTIPAPGPGYVWTLVHTAAGPAEGWVYTGVKATAEQLAAIQKAEAQLIEVKKAAGLI